MTNPYYTAGAVQRQQGNMNADIEWLSIPEVDPYGHHHIVSMLNMSLEEMYLDTGLLVMSGPMVINLEMLLDDGSPNKNKYDAPGLAGQEHLQHFKQLESQDVSSASIHQYLQTSAIQTSCQLP